MKQTYSSLLSEKQAKAKQLQQVNSSLESLKAELAQGEDLVCSFAFYLDFICNSLHISPFFNLLQLLQMKTYLAQAANTSIENRRIAINMDKTKLELADSEKELKWLRAAVDVTKKEYERSQTKNLDLKTVLERERLFVHLGEFMIHLFCSTPQLTNFFLSIIVLYHAQNPKE